MEKEISNIELAGMIRAFVGANIGTGYAFAIERHLASLRPIETEKTKITESEAALIAAMVIGRVGNDIERGA